MLVYFLINDEKIPIVLIWREKILYKDTNSPTASIPFIMTIASIAAREQRHVKTIDITGAYLNADISKQQIYMELDPTMASIVYQT